MDQNVGILEGFVRCIIMINNLIIKIFDFRIRRRDQQSFNFRVDTYCLGNDDVILD